MRYFPVVLIFSLLGIAPCAQAQQNPFDEVAADAAAAIAKLIGTHSLHGKVLVADFVETRGHPTALGGDLAEQFGSSLQTYARNYTIVNRDEYLRLFAADKLSKELYEDPATIRCYASALDAAFVVTGELDDLEDKVVVWVKVTRIVDRERIFDKRLSLPLSPSIERLLRQVPAELESSNSDRSTPDLSVNVGVPTGGKNGYSLPVCLYCPLATFSDEAVKEKIQGTVLMSVRVGADGFIKGMEVVHGLPCGLNQQAIDSVRTWRMRPATGPNGEPAEVIVQIETTLRLY
jgi:TonB family protein